ncbi:MAG: hypothetical protein E7502_00175 [Ruminococcus sp.]|nr:hypothetical protein [Ruminococcus sp.]
MKKNKLTAFIAAFCLLCTGIPVTSYQDTCVMTAAAATDEQPVYGDFNYTVEDGYVALTAYTGDGTNIEIPTEIEGMPVTKLGATLFYEMPITEIVIPEGITTICSGAFWHCKSLAKVTLPSTLETIEGFVFNDCKALENIDIPKSVTYIGNSAFTDTPWLNALKEKSDFVIINNILIDATNSVQTSIDTIQAERDKLIAEVEDSKIWRSSSIVTNQLGYFTEGVKEATIVTEATEPLKFDLLNGADEVVFSGTTIPHGYDIESGNNVQIIDFSEFTTDGVYSLKAETGETSKPFHIGLSDIYSGLLTDSLNYFYQARSGVPIEEQYITSGEKAVLARDAGHASDVAEIYHAWGYDASSGKQDVTGGWYDAGDHGKYVVNGGVSLWLMQNEYERADSKGTADAYKDGAMAIPENNNGYPDLLDEARFEMEWMMKMLVMDGECKDMVYHKVHGIKWTALGLNPAKDTTRRILMPPSTAATLNVAACAAQSARLWKEYDEAFAEQCLDVAKRTYAAAKAHPEMYAPLTDTIDGGGPYGDNVVTDEFYWAACELYATTGDEAYYADMQASDWAFQVPANMNGGEATDFTGSFDWGHTAALGSLSMLLHPDTLTEAENKQLKESLTATADHFTAISESQGYGLTYKGTHDEGDEFPAYTWGSNSFVADNAIVLAYAYDETQNKAYLNSVVNAMDYLLGRNPLDLSYVTGYGVHSSQYPHHRWWAISLKPDFPKAPCGVLVGGPNSGMEDTVVQDLDWKKGKTAPQLMYYDDIEAYSVNEVTINWNTPLAWLTSYLLEQNGGIIPNHESTGKQLPEIIVPTFDEPPMAVITIPDGVTTIGEQIFGKLKASVEKVIIPDSVTSISKDAFMRCSKLETIELPSTIENIGDNAFADTPWLKNNLADSPLLIINDILIDGTTATGDVVIPEGVKSILSLAFKFNKEITSVTMPESVQRIGSGAFQGCTNMTSAALPDSLREIDATAFADTGLTSLTIPEGVKTIGSEAFVNCHSLFEATVKAPNAYIGADAFGCTSTFVQTGQYSYIFTRLVRDDFTLHCLENSTAVTYADKTGVAYDLITIERTLALGDINGDKIVDASDAAQILIAAAKMGSAGASGLNADQTYAADVNADTAVNAADAAFVLCYAAYVGSGGTDSIETFMQGELAKAQ